ncbi:putative Ig domain-containing protein [Spirosoma agri]|uniref:LTD domain-containing protein n=1 Tax=Spirosoma agri TaxID=1987381 RepID=A0A6M0IEV6_9BACT|nr:putative Ig domain-containing protein [Spirosoma agri]NEU65861.1 hypothetical protein [Spirosoma agri]
MKHLSFRRLRYVIYYFLGLFSAFSGRAQFTAGNVVVLQAGNATAPVNLTNTGNPIVLKEFSPVGQPATTVTIPTTGGTPLVISGSAASEGLLTRAGNGQSLVFSGYAQALPNTIQLASSTAATINRAIGSVNASGTFSRVASSTSFHSSNNIRGAASDGANKYWSAGGNDGTDYFGLGTPVNVQNTNANTRSVAVFGGKLYFSTQSGTTLGVYQVGSGLPTTSGQPTSVVISTVGTGTGTSSPAGFFFNETTTICYIADGRSIANGGGVQKWVNNGSAWTLAYTLGTGSNSTNGTFGVTADFSGTNPIVYATTTEATANRLIKITDTGTGSAATVLATAPANTSFRGVAAAPAVACPTITASLQGTTTICSGTSANLSATILGGTGPYSLTYSDGTTNTTVSNYVSNAAISVNPTSTKTYSIIAVSDANACSGTVSGSGATITVNAPPTVANAGVSQTITSGSSAVLAANAPTTGAGVWTVASGPSTSASQLNDPGNPSTSFTPAGGAGEYVLTWTITNAPCPASASSVTITVTPTAQPDLTVSVAGPVSAIVGDVFAYSLVVSNSGLGNATAIDAQFILPAGASFSGISTAGGFVPCQSGSIVSFDQGVLSAGTSTTLIVRVTANAPGTVSMPAGAAVVDPNNTIAESNEANNNSTETFSTTVVPANQPPVAPGFTNQTGIVAVPFSYTVPAFTDPENQPLSYTITNLPTGLTADNASRIISGTPTTGGTSTVTIVASDPQSATTAGTFTITINANAAPTPAIVSNQTATVGVAFSYTIPTFTDSENQSLTYAAMGLPAPLTFDPATRIISGTPSTTGVSAITITATDPASNTASAAFSLTVSAAPVANTIQITEYMYNGSAGEFIELTNVSNAPVDMTGWSFDDASRTPGSFPIGGFGVVQPGESVIISELAAAAFRTNWYLPASVKVVGGNNQNLGNGDEINIYDASNTLVDRLTYGNTGNVITNGTSAWPTTANLNATTATSWQLSVVGDAQNSYAATTGNIASPGGYYSPLNRVLVRESGGTTVVTEGGATDTYTIALNSQPSSDVTITVNPGSQLTTNSSTLTFTSANFSSPQTVLVTAIDDAIYQGAPRSVTITQSAASNDAAYNGIVVNPVSVTITDNDQPASAAPTIQVASTTTRFVNLPANGPGYVSGVANDPTDPASTLGIDFTLADTDSDVASLTVTATSNNANATLNLSGTGSSRNLKLVPAGIGYSVVTVAVTDGLNTTNYVINYAASAASVTPATTRFHTETSDASTAILVDANYMLVADDENQRLRLYDRQQSGLPVAGFDFTSSLGLTDVSGGVPREVDLEASVRQNNRIFWIGSQSNADGGNARPNRDRVFATDVSGSGAATTLNYVGRYDFLREDIINWDLTNGHGKGANYYGLQASATPAVGSKQPSGYNIEGAEFGPDGNTVYIGLRAPQIVPANRTKALIIPVLNLTNLVSGQAQGSATFGAPIELDLGGRGIREIRKNTANQYIIVAGAAGDAGAAPNDFRLFTWTGNANDAPLERNANLTALSANGSFESIVEVPASLSDNTQIQLLVDNGDAVYYNDGTIAKELTQNNFKKFRSDIVALGSAPNTAPTVANAIAPQSATVGTGFSFVIPANTFSDAQTPNGLTLSVSGLPAGLSFIAPSTISGTPSTTVGSPFTITVTATDPGSLSVSTSFALTVNPATVVTPASFTIASVTTVNCATLSAGERSLTFNPVYSGTNGSPITFSVVNELGATTEAGPYTLRLYTDNPTIALRATQDGTQASFAYNWLAACSGTPPTNTAPTVANVIAPQSATVGTGFSYMIPANTFSDAQTPNALSLSVSGLPAGLSFIAPATISGTPSTTVGSPFTITVTATDPGSLSVSTSFALTVNPATVVTPASFTIASVTTVNCATLSAGERSLTFNPVYSGANGSPITFSVVNELGTTTAAGPYTLRLYTDNPTITLRATQDGTPASFTYNWLAACSGTPPTNTAPTVANVIVPQSATVGTGFSFVIPANTFSDAQTPNALSLSVSGLPAGLSFIAPATISGTPSTTVGSPFTITVTATDPGSLSVSTSFALTVNPATVVTPGSFTIANVNTINCVVVSGGERSVTFNPVYNGASGSPITFSVVNELGATTVAGPYTLRLYTDNPTITLRATQDGTQANFTYNWLAACSPNTRVGASEHSESLSVTVLGNPVVGESVEVHISGVAGQAVQLNLVDLQGKLVNTHRIEQAQAIERVSLPLGARSGLLFLDVSTSTQHQQVKVLKP